MKLELNFNVNLNYSLSWTLDSAQNFTCKTLELLAFKFSNFTLNWNLFFVKLKLLGAASSRLICLLAARFVTKRLSSMVPSCVVGYCKLLIRQQLTFCSVKLLLGLQ